MNEQTTTAGGGGKRKEAAVQAWSRKILAGAALALVTGTALGQGMDLAPESERTDAVLVREFDGTPLDLNNDTFVDVVIGNVNVASAPSRIYFGNGDGTFTESAATLSSGFTTSDLDAGDIDGDGDLDIVQSNRGEVNNYFLGDGTGNFGAATAIGAETDLSSSIDLADMNGDGLLDVVVANTDDQVNRVYLNTSVASVASFAPPVDITADADYTRHIAIGDVDGDGDLDVVAGNDDRAGCGVCGTAPSKVYLNTLAGGVFGFDAGIALTQSGESVDDLELTDLDGDDDLDLVKVTFNTVNQFYLNQSESGTFSFGAPTDISADTDNSNAVDVADIDGDGDFDVIVANGDTSVSPVVGEINRLYLNQFVESGTVSFDAGQDISTDAQVTRDIVGIDLDGVNGPDVIAGNRDVDRVYLNNGTATPFANVFFTSTPVTTATVDVAYSYTVTAMDEDGDPLTITAAAALPAWLTLTDNGNGTATLSGTPTAADVGDEAISLQASDGTNVTTQDFTITVNVAGAPVFDSTPITDATVGVVYTYEVMVSDSDGDPVTITAPTLPAWLTFTDNGDGTATLTGTPADTDIGDDDVSLEASDGTTTTTQDFTITVVASDGTNTPPEFTSTAVTEATVDEAYSYSVTATDADGDTLTITSITLPAWLTLTDNSDGTATLSGTPAAADAGENEVSLQVSDGTDTAMQDFTITVAEAAEPPPEEPPPEEPPPEEPPSPVQPRGDGGGGALGLWSFIALLGMFGAARRRRPV